MPMAESEKNEKSSPHGGFVVSADALPFEFIQEGPPRCHAWWTALEAHPLSHIATEVTVVYVAVTRSRANSTRQVTTSSLICEHPRLQ